MKSIAIVGGGIAGVTAAWQLAQLGIPFTLYEATHRLGGTVETIHPGGFTIELGPDGWITENPWARELAIELGLEHELISSNDATRVTYILRDGRLIPIPDGMRLMVPTNLAAIEQSRLFSAGARRAYAAEPGRAAELRASAPEHDESIASFVERHFGPEVLHTIATPLLSGVFGGDVATLSVRAVMPQFVQMERTHGSLITALQTTQRAGHNSSPAQPIFTTLRSGTQTLIDRMAAALPAGSVQTRWTVERLSCLKDRWVFDDPDDLVGELSYDEVIVTTPAHVTRKLLGLTHITRLLPREESSAILAAYAFTDSIDLPQGFGFLVPASEPNTLLAGTFVDQKYPDRCPPGTRLLRAFFGGRHEPANDRRTDAELAAEAFTDLEKILGPLPRPTHTKVRRWPRSLPQYAVGHLDRMAELDAVLKQIPTLHLLGNAYRGVGLPNLIRDARATARQIASQL